MLRVGGGLGGLTGRGQRPVAGGFLGGNLRSEETIVDSVLEATQPALPVLGRMFRRWGVSHVLTLHRSPQWRRGRMRSMGDRPPSYASVNAHGEAFDLLRSISAMGFRPANQTLEENIPQIRCAIKKFLLRN
jgi:hypothetical protein